jgi:DNA-directed RNA polymerase subunit M/transcription elongation factor TFIIS
MWKIKSCPKCGGDLYLDYDEYGDYNHCLQCGYTGNIDPSCLISERPGADKLPTFSSK